MENERLIWAGVLRQKWLKMPVNIRVCKINFYVLIALAKLCLVF